MPTIATLTLNPAIDIDTDVPVVVPEHKLRCGPPRYEAGGGGINVARAVRNLGGDALAIYPSGGPTGELLRRLLDVSGLRHRPIPTECSTRFSFTVDETTTRAQYRFVLPGPPLAENEWRGALQCLASLRPTPQWLVASGSLPPAVPDDFYARIARIAHEQGARFVLDTSGPALKAALAEGVFMVKPNRRELEHMAGRPASDLTVQEALARELVARGGAEVVALSLGADGALLTTAHRQVRVRAPAVTVVSAVGAGDSFVGGMVLALSRGWDIEDAFRYGVAAGSAALLSPGTELCRPEDVARFYDEITRMAPIPPGAGLSARGEAAPSPRAAG